MTTFIIEEEAVRAHPDRMSPDERLAEVAAILATGVRRLLKKRETEKISLDKSPGTCPYVRKTNQLGERT